MAVCFSFDSCGNTNSYTNQAYCTLHDEVEDEDETVDYENEEYGYTSDDENEVVYEDGTYTATVDYYNPNTDYYATYTLDVDVEDGQVIQINFPKGGWLDEDHIIPEYLDENSSCTIYTYEGRIFKIQID